MKRYSILTALLVFITFGAFAQTNVPTVEQVKQAAVEVVHTNINQVLVEILSGVKGAGSEIYGASKEAIHKSVDFVSEEAPQVVQQFIIWRMFKAITWIIIWILSASFLLFFANKLRLYQPKASDRTSYGDPSERQVTTIFKWILSVLACITILLGVGTNAFEVVKIKVAPKFYILEYVIDVVKPDQNITRH